MTRIQPTRRIACLLLPDFPMARRLRQLAHNRDRSSPEGSVPPADQPFALWTEGRHGPIIHAVNGAALQAGISPGARLTDIRTICPSLRAAPADPAGDEIALAQLALWMRRFCPWTAVDHSGPGPAGLVLDTTGAAHLWGGEAGLLAAITTQLAAIGHQARAALAPSWGAAWALSRFGQTSIANDPAAIHPLPVAALRLSSPTVLTLRRLGLKTVGDLAGVPRIALTRRFARHDRADNPLIRLDQAMGHLAEPISPPDPPPQFRRLTRLAEPVLDATHHLPGLCVALCRDLAAAAQGARLLRLTVWRSDGEMRWIEAGAAAPSRDPAHFTFLFRDRLERIDPGFGFDLIELAAPETEPLTAAQPDLTGQAETGRDLSRLIDRLTARFGPDRLMRPALQGSHIPERSMAETPAMAAAAKAGGKTRKARPRKTRPSAGAPDIAEAPQRPPATCPPASAFPADRHPPEQSGTGTPSIAALRQTNAEAGKNLSHKALPRSTDSHIPKRGSAVPMATINFRTINDTADAPSSPKVQPCAANAPTIARDMQQAARSPLPVRPRPRPASPTDRHLPGSDSTEMPVTAYLWKAPKISDAMVSPCVHRSTAPEKARWRTQLCTTALPPIGAPFPHINSGIHDRPDAGASAIATFQHIDNKANKPFAAKTLMNGASTAAGEPQRQSPPCVAPVPPCAALAATSPSLADSPAVEHSNADAWVAATPRQDRDNRTPPLANTPTATDGPPRMASATAAVPPAHRTVLKHGITEALASGILRQASDATGKAPLPSTNPPRQAPTAPSLPAEDPALAARPLRLFDPPEELAVLYAVPEGPPAQFRWRGRIARITRWQGPERIAPEWWIDRPGARLRDYYKIEDADGCRLWIYREGLAGDGRGDVPRWFVQGIFA